MKKICVTILCIVMAFCLAGCGLSVEYAVYSDADYYHEDVSFSLPKTVINNAEETATMDNFVVKGTTWTLKNYIRGYLERYTTFDYVSDKLEGNNRVFCFSRAIPLADLGEAAPPKTKVSGNFFVKTYTETYKNPFTDYYASYKEAEKDVNDYKSMFGIIIRGDRAYYQEDIPPKDPSDGWLKDENGKLYKENYPSLFSAFPDLEKSTDNIATKTLIQASRRKDSNGSTITVNGKPFYYFSTTFSDQDAVIMIKYYRLNSTAWFLIALIGGGIAVLVSFFIAKSQLKKRKKAINAEKPKNDVPTEKPKNDFPIDPFL